MLSDGVHCTIPIVALASANFLLLKHLRIVYVFPLQLDVNLECISIFTSISAKNFVLEL